MRRCVYRYVLSESVPFAEARATLDLALLGTQGLYGEASVRLDGRYAVDEAKRALAIDACTPVGGSLNRLFVEYIRREFGEDAIRIERMIQDAAQSRAAAGA